MRRLLAAAFLAALLPAPAGAATTYFEIFEGTLTPEVGAPEELSGTLSIEVGELPLGVDENTTFDVVTLDAESSGGTLIALRDDLENPGLGVLDDLGEFLVLQLFLTLDDGETMVDLTVPDVEGSVVFSMEGDAIASLTTAFEVESGGPQGLLAVSLSAVATPEPAASAAGAAVLLVVASLARRRRIQTEMTR